MEGPARNFEGGPTPSAGPGVSSGPGPGGIAGIGDSLRTAIKTTGENIEATTNRIVENVATGAENVRESVGNALTPFATGGPGMVNATNDYLNSNSMIAKFAFVVLVLLAFFFLVNLGIRLLGYFMQSPTNPYLIYGMVNGNEFQTISQDPRRNNASMITRSNDRSTGMEFTWSVWLLVHDNAITGNSSPPAYLHVFNKGDPPAAANNVSVNNGPGLYLSSNSNATYTPELDLHVVMDTVTTPGTTLDVSGVPFNQWFHVAIRLENTLLDVYVNGTISARRQMAQVPKQNYNDVNVGANGGFNGNLSNLRYYARALSAFEINGIVMGGPNTNISTSSTTNQRWGEPYYLSRAWYHDKI